MLTTPIDHPIRPLDRRNASPCRSTPTGVELITFDHRHRRVLRAWHRQRLDHRGADGRLACTAATIDRHEDRRTDDKIATEKIATETLDQGPGDLRRRSETPRDIPVTGSNHADHPAHHRPPRPPGHPLIPTSQAFHVPTNARHQAERKSSKVGSLWLATGPVARAPPVSKSRQALRLGRHLPAVCATRPCGGTRTDQRHGAGVW